MEHEINSIAPKPAAHVLAITFLFMGILGVVVTLLLSWWRPESFTRPEIPALVMQPLILAALGYIATRIFCSIYNRVANRRGGIRIYLTEIHSPFNPKWKP